jgi:CRP/FNR family transcriptional regulator
MHILKVSPQEKFKALSQSEYFCDLSDNIIHKLVLGTSLRLYARGETIFWSGDPSAGLHIVRRGSVKLFKLSPKGRELIIKLFEEGASFNEVPVFDHGTNPVSVAALEESEIWLVDSQVIRKAMTDYPDMMEKIILNLCNNLRMLVRSMEELSFYQVTSRLARLISRLSEQQLEGDLSQRVTQDQLAAHLGTVREVVARALRDLERSSAIQVNHGRIQIVDRVILEDWAQAE